jgi:molecular chaperone DnaK (HSP70)
MNSICIDFGTCNTVISYIEDNILKQIHDDCLGDVLIPTTIYFDPDKSNSEFIVKDALPSVDYYIGGTAVELVNSTKNWENYFFQFKRVLGITTKSLELSRDFLTKYNLEYTTDESMIYFYLNKVKFSICDLIGLFFKGLHKKILDVIPNCINSDNKIPIFLTCPAYFHDLQRYQLKKAVESVGFIVIKMINEPTAAAIYYINKCIDDSNKQKNPNESVQTKYIIYDLGGGTIDTTVVDYFPDSNTCEVIDIDGNNGLGGIDLDNILTYDIISRYSIEKTPKWLNKIKKCAEEIKIKLTIQTTHTECLEEVPIFSNGNKKYSDLKITYSRQMFNNLVNKLIDQMIEPIQNMFIKYKTSNIIFIGGPTQIPLLKSKVSTIIGKTIETHSEFIHPTHPTHPTHSILYKTIVSLGGSILYKKITTKEDFCLLDIIPMNIGISGLDNKMITLINKNSKIPITIEKVFSTSRDCQRTIDVEIYEGVNELCTLNTFIGSYKIIGIPPLPRGQILIKLIIKISSNGLLELSIGGSRNSSDNNTKSYDYKFDEKIQLISSSATKELLRKLLLEKKNV